MKTSKTNIKQLNNNLQELILLDNKLSEIRASIREFQTIHLPRINQLHSNYLKSGENFICYLALRQIELKDLQMSLAHFGLSSLGHCESNVLHAIEQVQNRIADSVEILSKNSKPKDTLRNIEEPITWFDAEKLIHSHTQALFGEKPHNRHVYIMVTALSNSEMNEDWIRNILKAGTNVIRINCAHGSKKDWKASIERIREISAELKIPCKIFMDLAGPKIRTVTSGKLRVSIGEKILLSGSVTKGSKTIQCSIPEVLNFVKIGERVFIDDGLIETIVIEKLNQKLTLEVTRVPFPDTKIRDEKGINFPDSHIQIEEITEKDILDLKFIGKHADIIGMSFVQNTTAIRKVRSILSKQPGKSPGIVLKIETKAGFQSLPKLLLEAMKDYPCGVMIARGDLAVEVGFERMVEIQEEILWLCEAAHVPVIWATQVLDNQAKLGLASRAEVTDAAASVQAECVMLNKGPFIERAVLTLDNILKRMEFHTYKKRTLNRLLKVAKSLSVE